MHCTADTSGDPTASLLPKEENTWTNIFWADDERLELQTFTDVSVGGQDARRSSTETDMVKAEDQWKKQLWSEFDNN